MALTKIDDRGLKTPIDLQDNEKIRLGTGNDLEIYHDGSNSYIDDAGTGNLYLRGSASIELRKAGGTEKMLYAEPDAQVELYYDNSKKFETSSTGVTFGDNWLYANDNAQIRLGNGADIKIYHDGSNSYLTNDTGVLNIQGGGGNIQLQAVDGESGLIVKPDDAVELYHNGSKKIETTSTGATATGHLTVQDTSGDSASSRVYLTSGNTADSSIYFGRANDTATAAIRNDHSDDSLRFYGYNNTERMRIDADGRVGVGIVPQASQYSGWTILQVGESAALTSNKTTGDTNTTELSNNSYLNANASAYKYHHNDEASRYTQSHGRHAFFVAGSGSADADISFTEELRIDSDGLKFNGDTAAANALDDYEEGTFTPGLGRSGSNPTASFYTRQGRYIKIGKLVYCSIMVDAYNVSGGSGQWYCANFPFNTYNDSSLGWVNTWVMGRLYFDSDYAMGANGKSLRTNANNNTWYLYNQDDDATVTGDASRIIFQGHVTYMTN